MSGDPEGALEHLTQTVKLSHDPRTIAWAHIYLGRLYDLARDPDNPDAAHPQRSKAVAEYQIALANRDGLPDTKVPRRRASRSPSPCRSARSLSLTTPRIWIQPGRPKRTLIGQLRLSSPTYGDGAAGV